MKRKAGYMKVEVCSAESAGSQYRVVYATRNLNDLKAQESANVQFRILGPCAAPDAVLDVDGAYRRPAHVML